AQAGRKERWAVILASGPLSCLLLAVVALTGWAGGPQSDGVETGLLALGLALQALHSCVFSLMPGRRKQATDGEQLWALVRHGGRYELDRPTIWLVALLQSNVRLKELPLWLIETAKSRCPLSPEMAQFVDTIDAGRVLDRVPVDVATVRGLLDAYRGRYGEDEWVMGCDAYLAAIWEADADRAQTALAAIPALPDPPPLTLAALAAVAARIGETELARRHLEEMRKALKRQSPFRNPTFEDVRRQIEGLLAPSPEALVLDGPRPLCAQT
ncbi:MAG: hypothetical protein JWO81_1300, partial [Alphaproteobacteria bacterium]|nr:hypothetical protein [Alphaproteobacteria bacterium]